MMRSRGQRQSSFTSTRMINGVRISWIVLGAMTGPGSNRHQPKQEWVEALARDAADTAVPVFMKDSLGPIVGEENMLRELPWG